MHASVICECGAYILNTKTVYAAKRMCVVRFGNGVCL